MFCVITVGKLTVVQWRLHTCCYHCRGKHHTRICQTKDKPIKDGTPEASTLIPEAAIFHFSFTPFCSQNIIYAYPSTCWLSDNRSTNQHKFTTHIREFAVSHTFGDKKCAVRHLGADRRRSLFGRHRGRGHSWGRTYSSKSRIGYLLSGPMQTDVDLQTTFSTSWYRSQTTAVYSNDFGH